MPKLPEPIARHRQVSKHGGVLRGPDEVIHTVSGYTVHSSIENGLEPDFFAGKEGLIGVFCYRLSAMQRATAGASYAVYSYDGCRFYASLRFELAVDKDRAGDPSIGKESGAEGQLVLKPSRIYLCRLWFNIVTKVMATHEYCRTRTHYEDWIPTVEILRDIVAGPCRTTNL